MTAPRTILAAIAAIALLTACHPAAADPTAPGSLAVGNPAVPVPAPGACHLHHTPGGDLPDLACTPGALNPAVTQDTIGSTICVAGWTKTVRPPTSLTTRLKRQLDAAYGLPSSQRGELDHLVSLELGGAPTDPRNLWTEPGKIPNRKDGVEGTLHRAVCAHRVTLAAAQTVIAHDWTTAETVLGLPDGGGTDPDDE